MNSENSIESIVIGDSMMAAQEKLGLGKLPGRLPDPDKLIYFYHLPDIGFWVFFNENGSAYSIRFEYPYPNSIEGVKIGDTKKKVSDVLGKPKRYLPLGDGKSHWVYEKPHRVRVDFNVDTRLVEKIFRL